MGKIRPAPSALLFTAITVSDLDLLEPICNKLEKSYGQFLNKLTPFRFSDMTEYYKNEMGEELWKTFVLFKEPISLEHVANYKIESNKLEETYTQSNKRKANIDPGYLTLFNFCLLTTKGFSHRVYLENGIYTEVTLIAKEGRFQPQVWTYSDYKTPDALNFLEEGRLFLKKQQIK